jgi:hypothetical protein
MTTDVMSSQFFQHVGPLPSGPSNALAMPVQSNDSLAAILYSYDPSASSYQEDLSLRTLLVLNKLLETLRSRRESDKEERFRELKAKIGHDANGHGTQKSQATGTFWWGIGQGTTGLLSAFVAKDIFTAVSKGFEIGGNYSSVSHSAAKTLHDNESQKTRAFYDELTRQLEEALQSAEGLKSFQANLLQILQEIARNTTI